ncbi:MAG: L,D-transpeptidase family protein [Sphingosinicella sp.]|uniref:L,D-transpeptidase family protein n=1 Tax=Sphingosinicella sp. TaxID=1917971 RepID=UPI0040383B69
MRDPVRLVRAVLLAGAFALLLPIGAPRQASAVAPAAPPAPLDVGDEIAGFYRDRGFAPLWVTGSALRPEAGQLLAMLDEAGRDDPNLREAVAAARSGDPHRLTRADLLLSRAFADYVRTYHRAPERNTMRYIDPGLAPETPGTGEALEVAAEAPSLAAHLEAVERINPVVEGLTSGLAAYRAGWSRLPQIHLPGRPSAEALRRRLGGIPLREFQRVHGLPVTGNADAATVAALNHGASHYERLIQANIERASAIPAHPNGRYILVDTASARLWMIEHGRIVDAMRVIVGKRAMPTPVMAGLIRYATLNPYWNLPPDLIRERARGGARAMARERLQVLSDWSPNARRLDPHRVDWRAVAAGRRLVNLRQTPGPHNMMGRIKFMMPNHLGIYLHDTPHRGLFRPTDRHFSSGCVRLEDAGRLERWLFNGRVPRPSGAPEQRVDLPEPVPVYIAYFTALPSRGGVVFVGDPYRRDVTPGTAPRREARARRGAPEAFRARRGRG